MASTALSVGAPLAPTCRVMPFDCRRGEWTVNDGCWAERVVDLLGQSSVGAQDHELCAPGAFDDLRISLMQQRLAAGDRDDGRTALVDRAHATVVRQPLVEDLAG